MTSYAARLGMPVVILAWGSLLAQDAYVPNQGSDDLTIFDIRNPVDRVTRPLGSEPHEGVFVSNRLDHDVAVYEAATRNELTRIPVGNQPHGVAVTPDNRYVFVANDGSGDVTVIEIATLLVVSTVPGVGSAPHMVAISPDGTEAWTGNIGGGDVSLIDVGRAITDPTNAVICANPPNCRIPAGACP